MFGEIAKVPNLFSLVQHHIPCNSLPSPKVFLEENLKVKPEARGFKNMEWLLEIRLLKVYCNLNHT